ncbi:hypothetical protein [Helicobacter salomonis]|nr:hypothetical protein [Helicobacter salomonis]
MDNVTPQEEVILEQIETHLLEQAASRSHRLIKNPKTYKNL